MTDTPEQSTRTNLFLGIGVLIAALLIAFVWIPMDVESGIFEKVRRRLQIGDAFAPTLAAALLGLGGLLLILESIRAKSPLKIGSHSLFYLAILALITIAFVTILTWTGPLLVALFAGEGAEYRLLRDTPPWKYAGFVVGGTFLVAALIGFIERRLSWQGVIIGLAASFLMILLYDVPFDDLLLPPNGDF